MKRFFQVFKITMSYSEARNSFILCVASCIAAFVMVKVFPTASALYMVIMAVLSMSSVSAATRYGQYFSAVLQKLKGEDR